MESRMSPGSYRERTGLSLTLAEGGLMKEQPAPALAVSFYGILLFLPGCTLHPHRLGPSPTLSGKGMCGASWGSSVGWELVNIPGKSQPSNIVSPTKCLCWARPGCWQGLGKTGDFRETGDGEASVVTD